MKVASFILCTPIKFLIFLKMWRILESILNNFWVNRYSWCFLWFKKTIKFRRPKLSCESFLLSKLFRKITIINHKNNLKITQIIIRLYNNSDSKSKSQKRRFSSILKKTQILCPRFRKLRPKVFKIKRKAYWKRWLTLMISRIKWI